MGTFIVLREEPKFLASLNHVGYNYGNDPKVHKEIRRVPCSGRIGNRVRIPNGRATVIGESSGGNPLSGGMGRTRKSMIRESGDLPA